MQITQQNLIDALKRISKSPDQMVAISADGNIKINVRLKPTGSGIKFGIKESCWADEGSAIHFPTTQLEEAAIFVHGMIVRKIANEKDVSVNPLKLSVVDYVAPAIPAPF